jgi:hypothetical protein
MRCLGIPNIRRVAFAAAVAAAFVGAIEAAEPELPARYLRTEKGGVRTEYQFFEHGRLLQYREEPERGGVVGRRWTVRLLHWERDGKGLFVVKDERMRWPVTEDNLTMHLAGEPCAKVEDVRFFESIDKVRDTATKGAGRESGFRYFRSGDAECEFLPDGTLLRYAEGADSATDTTPRYEVREERWRLAAGKLFIQRKPGGEWTAAELKEGKVLFDGREWLPDSWLAFSMSWNGTREGAR